MLIAAFNPLFKLSESHLPAPVILFATFGGLRGAVSLILAQMLVSQQDQQQKSRDMLQTAQVSVVCMTLKCSRVHRPFSRGSHSVDFCFFDI